MPTPQLQPNQRRSWATWLATGLGVGLAVPFAPGTFGTLWGIPLAFAIQCLPTWYAQVLAIAVLFVLGIPLCTRAARELGMKDPGPVVWDEIVTLPITFFLVPLYSYSIGWLLGVVGLGFALHRLFDITKIPPARQLERLPTGLGIMADDLAAGIWSCLALHGLLWIAAKVF